MEDKKFGPREVVMILVGLGCILAGFYSSIRKYQDARPIIRDINKDGLDDIVLLDKRGKPVSAYIREGGKYVPLRESLIWNKGSSYRENLELVAKRMQEDYQNPLEDTNEFYRNSAGDLEKNQNHKY